MVDARSKFTPRHATGGPPITIIAPAQLPRREAKVLKKSRCLRLGACLRTDKVYCKQVTNQQKRSKQTHGDNQDTTSREDTPLCPPGNVLVSVAHRGASSEVVSTCLVKRRAPGVKSAERNGGHWKGFLLTTRIRGPINA